MSLTVDIRTISHVDTRAAQDQPKYTICLTNYQIANIKLNTVKILSYSAAKKMRLRTTASNIWHEF